MNAKWPWTLLLLVLFLAGMVSPVRADGIIVPPYCPDDRCPPPPPCPAPDDRCPPRPRPIEQLTIRYHHVTVSIQDQLAVTRVDQAFFNPNAWPIEGTYIFPLPLDAVVSSFTLWIDGQPVKGEVLSAEQARDYYEETVRNLRDPALLEYEGRGAVRASVFPIQPQKERRIQLEYTQALTVQNGLVHYVYPLNTEKFSSQPLEDVSIQVEIHDSKSIRAVYSPSHPVAIDRKDGSSVTAGYEAYNVLPDADFSLFYSLGESEAFHLFSYRDPTDLTEQDGFFMLLLAPKPGEADATQRVSKDVLLVLDRSGSMEGEPFTQAQSAARYILKKLNPGDRFYVETFSTGVEAYADGLRSASEVPQALDWVDRLSAVGSTDINRALLEAAAVVDRERPTYLIFLTDGLPTEGVIDRQEILKNFARTAPANLRVFPFGAGYNVDTMLLDTLSQEHHGQSTYVRPGEALDEALSAFYERISTPVLTDLKLEFGGLNTYDIYPNPLPDLFSGGQVIVVGRYKQGGTVDVKLRGNVNGLSQEFTYPGQRFIDDSRASLENTGSASNLDMLPRLWATRKIGYLLNSIRLNGPDKETIQQIVKLSVRYGIVTEYTSYLVTEPMPLGSNAQEKIAEDAFGAAQAAPTQASGKGAVDRAAQEGQMQSADQAPMVPSVGMGGGGANGGQPSAGEGSATQIRVVGARTFVWQNGAWTDTAFDPQSMPPQQVIFLSDDYFRLLAARPDLAASLALGDQVTVVVEGKAYQVVREGQSTGSIQLPAKLPTAASPTGLPTIEPGVVSQITPNPSQPTILPTKVAAQSRPAAPGGPCTAGFIPLGIMLPLATFLRLRR